ncbi:uncharacterized protein MAM_00927 [Metarhizium album ARSEF 1941]|uniref:Uncharacterized protein n=1 Tax=Metarhizium album (strain ARSEF 1941) TaxID=1081103 RepID=A0A0B2X9D6_METAS|nr:uncharacterized protein MAM_00927 [Metarhizium album ARSEF 1941]KHO01926.1 hypothetical protein MAM_00927 [Metarhizium album ARSEF 1941]
MPGRHRDADAGYHSDDDYSIYRPSRSPGRLDQLARAVDHGRFHDAKEIAKSALAGAGSRRREGEPYEYEAAFSDRLTRRCHDDAPGRGHRDADYHGYEGRRPRPGPSRHMEERHVGRRERSSHRREQPRARCQSENRVKEAATAALAAGLAEAIKSRHSRDQSKRAITAAVGAAAVDAFVSNGEEHGKGRHIAESAVSGLLIDRLAHGSSKH